MTLATEANVTPSTSSAVHSYAVESNRCAPTPWFATSGELTKAVGSDGSRMRDGPLYLWVGGP